MEADEGHSSEEAQPPSCLAPNANDGWDASPIFRLESLASSFSYNTSDVLSLPRRTLPVLGLSGDSCIFFVIKGGE